MNRGNISKVKLLHLFTQTFEIQALPSSWNAGGLLRKSRLWIINQMGPHWPVNCCKDWNGSSWEKLSSNSTGMFPLALEKHQWNIAIHNFNKNPRKTRQENVKKNKVLWLMQAISPDMSRGFTVWQMIISLRELCMFVCFFLTFPWLFCLIVVWIKTSPARTSSTVLNEKDQQKLVCKGWVLPIGVYFIDYSLGFLSHRTGKIQFQTLQLHITWDINSVLSYISSNDKQ